MNSVSRVLSAVVAARPLRFGFPLFVAVALAGGAISFSASGAYAQNNELKNMLDRIERLQRDLATLQRYVYRGEPASETAAPAPVTPGAALTGTQAARIEVRLSQFEAQLRELTGQIEEQAFRFNQLSKKVEGLALDLEARLQTAGSGGETSSSAAAAPAPSSTPGTIGTISQSDLAATQTAALAGGTPQEQYDQAFGLLSRTQYKQAATAFSAFLERNADHELAGNAKYWLGETYYVQGQYTEAAVTFAEGFQDYPNSPKAPDNLLKLGKSLAALDQNDDACGTYAELIRRYSSASPAIIKQARSEQKRLSCP